MAANTDEENKESYWIFEKFMKQLEHCVKLIDKRRWVHHTSCHRAYTVDALNAHRMNAGV